MRRVFTSRPSVGVRRSNSDWFSVKNGRFSEKKLSIAVNECEQFFVFLTDLFDQISKREELANVPFDRKAAARALRMYLGERA